MIPDAPSPQKRGSILNYLRGEKVADADAPPGAPLDKKYLQRYEITLKREIPDELSIAQFFSLPLIEQSKVHRLPGSIWKYAVNGPLKDFILAETHFDKGPVTLALRHEQSVDPCGASLIIVAYTYEQYDIGRYLINKYPNQGLEGYARIIPKTYSRKKMTPEEEAQLSRLKPSQDKVFNMEDFTGCVAPYAGVTILHILVMKRAYDEVRWLLEFYRLRDMDEEAKRQERNPDEVYREGANSEGMYDPITRVWKQPWKLVSQLIRGQVSGTFFDRDTSFGHYLGGPSFHFAIALNDLTMVDILLEYIVSGVTGADDFFAVDQYGNNVLHLCVERTLPDMFVYMIKRAKLIIKEKVRFSISEYDHKIECMEVVENALLRNLLTHVVNNDGHTPFTLAAAQGNMEMASLILGGRPDDLLVTEGTVVQDLAEKYKHLLAEVESLKAKVLHRQAAEQMASHRPVTRAGLLPSRPVSRAGAAEKPVARAGPKVELISEHDPYQVLRPTSFPPLYDHSEGEYMKIKRWEVCGIEGNLIELNGFDAPFKPFSTANLNAACERYYNKAMLDFNMIQLPLLEKRTSDGRQYKPNVPLKSGLEWMILSEDGLELFALEQVKVLIDAKWRAYGRRSFLLSAAVSFLFAFFLTCASILEKTHADGATACYIIALCLLAFMCLQECVIIRKEKLLYFSPRDAPRGTVLYKRIGIWILFALLIVGLIVNTGQLSPPAVVHGSDAPSGAPTAAPTAARPIFARPTTRKPSRSPSVNATNSIAPSLSPTLSTNATRVDDSIPIDHITSAKIFVSASSLLVAWLSLFYHMVATDVGYLLVIASHVLYYDVARALHVFAILIIAFGTSLTVLDVYGDELFASRRFLAILDSFKNLTIGLLSGNFFVLEDIFVPADLMWLFVLLTIAVIILGALLLSNLIVSMMTESYKKYEAQARLVLLRERLSIMLEEEAVMLKHELKAVKASYEVDFHDNTHADHINGPYVEIVTSKIQSVY